MCPICVFGIMFADLYRVRLEESVKASSMIMPEQTGRECDEAKNKINHGTGRKRSNTQIRDAGIKGIWCVII